MLQRFSPGFVHHHAAESQATQHPHWSSSTNTATIISSGYWKPPGVYSREEDFHTLPQRKPWAMVQAPHQHSQISVNVLYSLFTAPMLELNACAGRVQGPYWVELSNCSTSGEHFMAMANRLLTVCKSVCYWPKSSYTTVASYRVKAKTSPAMKVSRREAGWDGEG